MLSTRSVQIRSLKRTSGANGRKFAKQVCVVENEMSPFVSVRCCDLLRIGSGHVCKRKDVDNPALGLLQETPPPRPLSQRRGVICFTNGDLHSKGRNSSTWAVNRSGIWLVTHESALSSLNKCHQQHPVSPRNRNQFGLWWKQGSARKLNRLEDCSWWRCQHNKQLLPESTSVMLNLAAHRHSLDVGLCPTRFRFENTWTSGLWPFASSKFFSFCSVHEIFCRKYKSAKPGQHDKNERSSRSLKCDKFTGRWLIVRKKYLHQFPWTNIVPCSQWFFCCQKS